MPPGMNAVLQGAYDVGSDGVAHRYKHCFLIDSRNLLNFLNLSVLGGKMVVIMRVGQ